MRVGVLERLFVFVELSGKLKHIMAAKIKEATPSEDIGVLPMPNSKSSGSWWLVFGACVLLTLWTRLHKVT